MWGRHESQGDGLRLFTLERVDFIARRAEMAAVAAGIEERKAVTRTIVLARFLAFIKTCVCARRRVQKYLAQLDRAFVVDTHRFELTFHFNSAQISEVFGDRQLILRDRLALELVIVAIRAEKTAIPTLEIRDAVAFWLICAQALALFKRRDFSWQLQNHLLVAGIAFGVLVPRCKRCHLVWQWFSAVFVEGNFGQLSFIICLKSVHVISMYNSLC